MRFSWLAVPKLWIFFPIPVMWLMVSTYGRETRTVSWRGTSRKLVLDGVCWCGKSTDAARPPKLGARRASQGAFL